MNPNIQMVSTEDSKNSALAEGRLNLPLLPTRREVAAALSCTERHLINLERRGIIRPIRLGRMVRFRRESLLNTLAKLEGAAP